MLYLVASLRLYKQEVLNRLLVACSGLPSYSSSRIIPDTVLQSYDITVYLVVLQYIELVFMLCKNGFSFSTSFLFKS